MKPRGNYKPRKAPTKPTTLGERLRALRLAHGLTQVQVAERLFTDQTTVSSWERGKAAPSGAALAAVCMLFEVERKALETGEGLEAAYSKGGPQVGAAEGLHLKFDQAELGKRPGALVDLATGSVAPCSLKELKAAVDEAHKAKNPVWIVR